MSSCRQELAVTAATPKAGDETRHETQCFTVKSRHQCSFAARASEQDVLVLQKQVEVNLPGVDAPALHMFEELVKVPSFVQMPLPCTPKCFPN